MDSSPPTSRNGSRGLLLFDAIALVTLVFAAATWRLACVPWGDVFGDAYMALECAYHFAGGDWWISASQPIYGHGLCVSYAPLFLGADSLFEVASRRALVGAMVVPAYYLVGLTAAVRLFGADARAARLAALVVGLLALRSDLLALMGTSGTLGYFAPLLTLLIGLGWLRASTGKAPIAAIGAGALVPLAMMNHPFTLWLVPAAIVLLPLLIRHTRVLASLLALAVMALCSVPRSLELARLIEGNGFIEGIKQIADPGSTPSDLWQQLWPMIFDTGNLPLVVGLFLLIASPVVLRDRAHGRTKRERTLWAIAAALSLALTVSVGVALGYLRYYHLMFLHPFAVAGLAGWLALALGGLWPEGSEGSPPSWKHRLRAVVAGAALLALCLAPAYATTSTPLTPACMGGAPLTKEAGGCQVVADAIMADNPPGRITVDNLTGPSGGADSAVAVVLDLLVQGTAPQRLHAPGSSDPMTWYWIIDRFEITDASGEQVDFGALAARVDGVEVLLDLQRSGELVLVVRSEAGRLQFGELLCETLEPGLQLWGRTYHTWISQLLRPQSESIQYPEPYAPCLAQRIIQ